MTVSIYAIQEAAAVVPSWRRVFTDNDPFGWPFASWVSAGGVVYPTDGLHLTRTQYEALTSALGTIGETGFFISAVESDGLEFQRRPWGHWWSEQASYEEYCALDLTLENALYSRHGRWGVLISHEMHAVVGGTIEFVRALTESRTDWLEDLRMLNKEWSGNPKAEWLQSLPKFANRVDRPRIG